MFQIKEEIAAWQAGITRNVPIKEERAGRRDKLAISANRTKLNST